ncbi:MAG: glycoside hydrolase family 3 protein [Lachnospiraceae bacterium]
MGEHLVLDWNEYINTARKAVSEGCVLLENRNKALPLSRGERVSVFGRIQTHYYKSGTGSGGMVNVSKVVNILDGLRNSGSVILNEELVSVYEKWEEEHPFDEGEGWGNEPWCQEEMELTDEVVTMAKAFSDTAIVIIGRTAGEDRDAGDEPGSYRLTQLEQDMLLKTRNNFKKLVVLLNVGAIIDMSFVDKYNPDAVMYIWQGGMVGGDGTADVLTGKVSPSGKLTDTIAFNISDYYSDRNFGDEVRNYYCEDIYVGYRYFETFAKDKVRYPFGYGLSYGTFDVGADDFINHQDKLMLTGTVMVSNTSDVPAKEVVQVYIKAPQGELGKPFRVLVDFKKTGELKKNENEMLSFTIPYKNFASYDDSGVTGHRNAVVLEKGKYEIYVGCDVRSAKLAGEFELDEILVLEQLDEACAPVIEFERIKPVVVGDTAEIAFEKVPMQTVSEAERRKRELPKELECENAKAGSVITIKDVIDGRSSVEDFVSTLDEEDLSCIIRGEGMGSSLVTPGTASAFGGVTPKLRKLGLPAVCCDDGPSGMRLDSGVKAFSLPNGTMLASMFNTELVEELYSFTSMEMVANQVECLLGPGMNIHRHPLNGRNFEYFSEDPFVTGVTAGAMLKGLKKHHVTGTIKHFCGNNQEYKRRETDSVVSQRALREIYLKGFEMVVRDKTADSVMTTYGSVNGLWTAGNYDLNTTILRNQWGFNGIVMTDWWADINERGGRPEPNNFAGMVRAQNDLYMVCADSTRNTNDDNTLSSLADGSLLKAELQRCAVNIVRFVLRSKAMERKLNMADTVEIINRPKDEEAIMVTEEEYLKLDGELTIRLDDRDSVAGTDYILPLDIRKLGDYEVILTGQSDLSEVAQIPCTLFYTGVPFATFTFNGTGGKQASITRELSCFNRFGLLRLNVGKNGVKLSTITFRLLREAL